MTQSAGERAFQTLCVVYGIEQPQTEYRFCEERRFRFDFAFVSARLAIEIDGGTWAPGGGRHAKDADREKRNIAAAMGWRLLAFSPAMLRDDPAKCMGQVKQALGPNPPAQDGAA